MTLNMDQTAHFRPVGLVHSARFFSEDGALEMFSEDIYGEQEVVHRDVPAGHWAYIEMEDVRVINDNEIGADKEFQVFTNDDDENVLFRNHGPTVSVNFSNIQEMFLPLHTESEGQDDVEFEEYDTLENGDELGNEEESDHGYKVRTFLLTHVPSDENGAIRDNPYQMSPYPTPVALTDFLDRYFEYEGMEVYKDFAQAIIEKNKERTILEESDNLAASALTSEFSGDLPEVVHHREPEAKVSVSPDEVPIVLSNLMHFIIEGGMENEVDDYIHVPPVIGLQTMFEKMGGENSPMARMGKKMVGAYFNKDGEANLDDVSLTMEPKNGNGLVREMFSYIKKHGAPLTASKFGSYNADEVHIFDTNGVEMLAVEDHVGVYVYARPGISSPDLDMLDKAREELDSVNREDDNLSLDDGEDTPPTQPLGP